MKVLTPTHMCNALSFGRTKWKNMHNIRNKSTKTRQTPGHKIVMKGGKKQPFSSFGSKLATLIQNPEQSNN